MYSRINIGESIEVDLSRSPYRIDGPGFIRFRWTQERTVTVNAETFQMLRRAVEREKGGSPKIWLIKALRTIQTDLSLKEAKDIVEWFDANYDLNAGLDY